MPFFFLQILIAGMLVTAAITFTACAAITPLRRFAITAPAASLVLSPALLFLAYQTWIVIHHVFIYGNSGPIPMSAYWILEVLAIAFFIALAFAFALFCRAVLEYGPPFLARSFGLKPLLLLQTVLLVGAVASALVDLALFVTLAHTYKGDMARVVAYSVIGLVATAICIRPLLHLNNAQRYSPKPLPAWLKQNLFVSALSSTPNSQ
jgi:hypothetical protein